MMQSKKTLAGLRRGLSAQIARHVDERRAALRDEHWCEQGARFVGEIERAAPRLENFHRAFHDAAMELRRAKVAAERLPKFVQEIEHAPLLRAQMVALRAQRSDFALHPAREIKQIRTPGRQRRQQDEEQFQPS